MRVTFVLALLLLTGCAKAPPTLDPATRRIWQADQAVVAIGTVQEVAIKLNGIQVCEPAPCHPLLSDRNTRAVVETIVGSLKVIQAAPGGWRATADQALAVVAGRLDAPGQATLRAYLEAARVILAGMPS